MLTHIENDVHKETLEFLCWQHKIKKLTLKVYVCVYGNISLYIHYLNRKIFLFTYDQNCCITVLLNNFNIRHTCIFSILLKI